MNDVERLLFEEQDRELFQRVVSESFDFIDGLIDSNDIRKSGIEEE